MNSLPFIVVEDRQNATLAACQESALRAGEKLFVLSSTDAGPGYDRFCELYTHLSTNSPAFEKICFRRYFLLSRLLASRPELEAFVLIDSDVLLFRGASSHIARLVGEADFSGSALEIARSGWNPCQISPHVSYWTSKGLLAFVNHVLTAYATAAGRQELQVIATRFAAAGVLGGVSDMTLLYLWACATANHAPINRVFDGTVIDHNINGMQNFFPREFKVSGGAKQIKVRDGMAWLTSANGHPTRVVALHFQGRAKLVMGHALCGRVRTVAAMTFLLQLGRRAKGSIFRSLSFLRRWRRALQTV